MKKKYLLYSLVSLLLLSGCYDREEKIAAPIVGELSDLQYKVDDDTLRVSWNLPSHNDDLQSMAAMRGEDTSIIRRY